jgi:hypothetical protein
MENFDFFIDRKVTIWNREYHTIEAKSLDEAKAKMATMFSNNMIENTFKYQDTLFDTEETMEPGDNGGNATIELYCSEDDQFITSNINL